MVLGVLHRALGGQPDLGGVEQVPGHTAVGGEDGLPLPAAEGKEGLVRLPVQLVP